MAATVVLDKLTEPSKSEGSMRVQAETDISVMGIPLKYAALAFLCAQNSCAVLVMRKSLTNLPVHPHYQCAPHSCACLISRCII